MHSRRRNRRRFAGPPRRGLTAVVLALCLGVVALPVAATEHDEPPGVRGIARVCPAPGQDPDAPAFPDAGDVHADAIACATAYRLVSGHADGTYRPSVPITRGQMATFVASWLQTATGIALSQPATAPYTDIAGSVHAAAIARLAEADIVGGRADGTFAPDAPLTRGQFARVIGNAISYADVFRIDGPLPPDGDPAWFDDVEGTTFAAEVAALAGAGIAVGDGRSFAPGNDVTRGQLATFLMRAADYLDRHQRWRPTASVVVLVADLEAATGTDESTSDPEAERATPHGTAVLTVNAFNGTLAFTVDLAAVEGPFGGAGGVTIRAGDPDGDAPLLLRLVDGTTLDEADTGVVTGVIREATSPVRFADLLLDPSQVHVRVANDAHPDGVVRGRLRAASSS